MTRYRISELAGPTGFSPSTLRYYEQVGLLSAERGRNGYRVYGDGDVTRLRFIARAKRLGLSLARIRDLVSAWDGGQCEPVKARLDEMLSARSRVTAERIGELITFDAELSDARRALAARTPPGPCDDGCGCTADPARPAGQAGPAGQARPTGGEMACSLGASDMAERIGEWTDMLSQATDRRPVSGGVSITFPAEAALIGRLADLAVREQRCCAFVTFAVIIAAGRVTLEVRAPQEARQLLPRLFAAA
jgi:DNA-binding transcriptional MerR regulator